MPFNSKANTANVFLSLIGLLRPTPYQLKIQCLRFSTRCRVKLCECTVRTVVCVFPSTAKNTRTQKLPSNSFQRRLICTLKEQADDLSERVFKKKKYLFETFWRANLFLGGRVDYRLI